MLLLLSFLVSRIIVGYYFSLVRLWPEAYQYFTHSPPYDTLSLVLLLLLFNRNTLVILCMQSLTGLIIASSVLANVMNTYWFTLILKSVFRSPGSKKELKLKE